jgi:hypothetical protein
MILVYFFSDFSHKVMVPQTVDHNHPQPNDFLYGGGLLSSQDLIQVWLYKCRVLASQFNLIHVLLENVAAAEKITFHPFSWGYTGASCRLL